MTSCMYYICTIFPILMLSNAVSDSSSDDKDKVVIAVVCTSILVVIMVVVMVVIFCMLYRKRQIISKYCSSGDVRNVTIIMACFM